MSEPARVVVVDDHDTFRDPLAFMLEREHDLTVLAKPRSLAEAREALDGVGLAVDVAIIDLNLPDGSDADLIKELRTFSPRAKALVLSASSDRKVLGSPGLPLRLIHRSAWKEDWHNFALLAFHVLG